MSPLLRRGGAQAPKYFCWLPAGSKNFRRGGCPGFKIFPMGLSGLRENLEERRIFPRSSGCEGSIFAAELPAPSKLQQWGCARFDISAARSPGASKDPQGAGQASKYVHCGSKGFKESQRGAARRGSVGFSKGFGAYSKMFAAELAAPSKLQQWAGASCKISAARSPGASKNPQGASQASTYFAVRATVKSLGLSGLRENLEERQIFPRCEGSTYLRRSCPRLQNFRAARASIYLRRVLQGLQKIRRALVRPLGILRGKQKLWKVSS